jgi:hypothetical protein
VAVIAAFIPYYWLPIPRRDHQSEAEARPWQSGMTTDGPPAKSGRHGRLASSIMALVALSQANDSTTVLAWDPANRTLIAANIVGTMPWTETR